MRTEFWWVSDLEDGADEKMLLNCAHFGGSGSLPVTRLKIKSECGGDMFLRNVGK
jgi:hypothetical protein